MSILLPGVFSLAVLFLEHLPPSVSFTDFDFSSRSYRSSSPLKCHLTSPLLFGPDRTLITLLSPAPAGLYSPRALRLCALLHLLSIFPLLLIQSSLADSEKKKKYRQQNEINGKVGTLLPAYWVSDHGHGHSSIQTAHGSQHLVLCRTRQDLDSEVIGCFSTPSHNCLLIS